MRPRQPCAPRSPPAWGACCLAPGPALACARATFWPPLHAARRFPAAHARTHAALAHHLPPFPARLAPVTPFPRLVLSHAPPLQGNTEPLEAAVAKLQRTKRPEREQLAAMLLELSALPVQPDEAETLDRLLKKFDRWAVSLEPPSCCFRGRHGSEQLWEQGAGRAQPASAYAKLQSTHLHVPGPHFIVPTSAAGACISHHADRHQPGRGGAQAVAHARQHGHHPAAERGHAAPAAQVGHGAGD